MSDLLVILFFVICIVITSFTTRRRLKAKHIIGNYLESQNCYDHNENNFVVKNKCNLDDK